MHTVSFAQLEGAETRRVDNPDCKKRCARMVMQRFKCGGKLHITVNPDVPHTMHVRMEHHLPHMPYIKISLTDDMKDFIDNNRAWSTRTVCM